MISFKIIILFILLITLILIIREIVNIKSKLHDLTSQTSPIKNNKLLNKDNFSVNNSEQINIDYDNQINFDNPNSNIIFSSLLNPNHEPVFYESNNIFFKNNSDHLEIYSNSNSNEKVIIKELITSPVSQNNSEDSNDETIISNDEKIISEDSNDEKMIGEDSTDEKIIDESISHVISSNNNKEIISESSISNKSNNNKKIISESSISNKSNKSNIDLQNKIINDNNLEKFDKNKLLKMKINDIKKIAEKNNIILIKQNGNIKKVKTKEELINEICL